MAIAQAYPLGTPKTNDLLVGTSIPAANTNENPKTVNFSVGNILALGNAPNVVTTTFTITDAQLRTLGTNAVTLLDLNGATFVGEYLQLISASFESIKGSAGSSYTWAASGAEISYTFGNADSNSFLIPQLDLPNGSGVTQLPYTIAARDGIYQRGSSLKLFTATNPVVVGEPNGAFVINLTYRLFPQIQ
jgi:hypothetical protein